MTNPILQARQLCRTVHDSSGALHLLVDIDFAVHAGQSVAVVGASGSGKSTLLGLLAGLDVPSSGQVLLAGEDFFQFNEDARAAKRAQHMGFVFQNFQLLPNLTALENVMLPLELLGMDAAAPVAKTTGTPKQRAQEMLERVGLGQRLGHLPKLLSGGEQQRVALARAFVVRPRILLADEPTGSLDHASGQAVMALMHELNRELGTTLFLVTHDDRLAATCQRVLRMEAGRLTEVVASSSMA